MDMEFTGTLWEWRGPAPYFWLSLPEDACDLVRFQAAQASYGWGAVPVRARIGSTNWETSLLPKDGGYALPVKSAVRKAEGIDEDDTVTVAISVAPRDGRRANGLGPTV